MVNIARAFRLRRFFPGGDADISGYLIPKPRRVSRAFLNALFASPDESTVYTLLKASRYAKLFIDNDFTSIEDYYYKALYDFNKRQYRNGAPGPYAPFAYLYLKEHELRELIHTIEIIRYNAG